MPENRPKRQMTVNMDKKLYMKAKLKCKQEYGIGLSALIKLFLISFSSQDGVGFYVGNPALCSKISRWLFKKNMEKFRGEGCSPMPGPKISDLYKDY